MIFYLHYILLTSGLSGTCVLLGVFFKTYSDATQQEIGVLLMSFPFVSIVIKPLFCSMADRSQAHKSYLIKALIVMLFGYAPFSILPFFPNFYIQFPRASWYLLVVACHIGNGGLGVAWSLGDSLAMNVSLKNNTPYSRMRLMGTISWGLYGYIIGQINEMPGLPKYVPSFFILDISVFAEIVLLLFWNDDDFVMRDPANLEPPSPVPALPAPHSKLEVDTFNQDSKQQPTGKTTCNEHRHLDFNDVDSTPSSLGGTLRLRTKTASALHNIITAEDLSKRLKILECVADTHDDKDSADNNNNNNNSNSNSNSNSNGKQTVELADFKALESVVEKNKDGPNISIIVDSDETDDKRDANPQIIIFKMILKEDGRLIKYLILFTLFGFLLAPMNFVFLSLEVVCREKGYNFSQLAGSVIISQAAIETISFLTIPWLMLYISRPVALTSGLVIVSARYIFYATYFYTANISPYWALIGEWGHGIAFGIFATLLADLALMFANSTRFFIPELRTLGYLSTDTKDANRIESEEKAIKLALRATMQAIFGGFMDGLGMGVGSLVCGFVAEAYSYIKLWQLYTIVSVGSILIYQLIEVSRSTWSDTFRPKKGTKAFEIMSEEVSTNHHDCKANNDKELC